MTIAKAVIAFLFALLPFAHCGRDLDSPPYHLRNLGDRPPDFVSMGLLAKDVKVDVTGGGVMRAPRAITREGVELRKYLDAYSANDRGLVIVDPDTWWYAGTATIGERNSVVFVRGGSYDEVRETTLPVPHRFFHFTTIEGKEPAGLFFAPRPTPAFVKVTEKGPDGFWPMPTMPSMRIGARGIVARQLPDERIAVVEAMGGEGALRLHLLEKDQPAETVILRDEGRVLWIATALDEDGAFAVAVMRQPRPNTSPVIEAAVIDLLEPRVPRWMTLSRDVSSANPEIVATRRGFVVGWIERRPDARILMARELRPGGAPVRIANLGSAPGTPFLMHVEEGDPAFLFAEDGGLYVRRYPAELEAFVLAEDLVAWWSDLRE